MLFFFTSRLISSLVAFLYPGYASYKTLSQRPASEEDLERWLMYWSVLGCVVGVEYVAEWAISWIPFYYTLKTLFLLYLALPQIQGSSYLYTNHLQPFFRTHESQIDTALAKVKAKLYTFLQQRARMVWDQAAVAMGQSPSSSYNNADRSLEEERGVGRAPPTTAAPGPAQLVSNLWASYGPAILAGGMALMRQTTGGTVQQTSPPGPGVSSRTRPGASVLTTPPSSHIRASSASQGRQQQEGAGDKGGQAATDSPLIIEGLPVSESGGSSTSRSSSNSVIRRNLGHRRDRSGSGGSGRFEEVEPPSDVEGYDNDEEGYERGKVSSSGTGIGGWFGWGSVGKGYERVKAD